MEKPKEKDEFDKEISHVLNKMYSMNPSSPEYENAVANLKVLCEARDIRSSKSISKEALLSAGTNLLGILLILNFERIGVITSKAISFVSRGNAK